MYLFILSLFFLSACSMEQDKPKSYEAKGQYWQAHINPEVELINGKRKFTITFHYLGSIVDINQTKKIVFAQGTRLGTEVVNVFDSTHKEESIKAEELYGIITEDLQNKKTTEFKVDYYFMEDADTDTFEAIEEDRMNIQILWERNNSEFNDVINIQ
ncbi:hypothetical protein [Paenibacillus soyae]|uniref:Uncharacterized protein n=1 Tax=Paenibacillus soyae TaxID=2969249 RepID=A0A9X2MLZ8_9BACL|nr:hypothetical protein [Paenibacillus soyae]MCR2802800.1 hypothetical protein [Paenibacillus soyae]